MCTCIEKFSSTKLDAYHPEKTIFNIKSEDLQINIIGTVVFNSLENLHNTVMANREYGAFKKGAVVSLCAVGFVIGSVLALAEAIVRLVVGLITSPILLTMRGEKIDQNTPKWKLLPFMGLVGGAVGIDLFIDGGRKAYQCFTQTKNLNNMDDDNSPIGTWMFEKIKSMLKKETKKS